MSFASTGSRLKTSFVRWSKSCLSGWDSFWFTPRLPHTLGLIRIATGLMLLYAHLVLATDLLSFLGAEAWINNDTARQLHDGAFRDADMARSYLWHLDSPSAIWAHHVFTIVVTACFAAGFLTRVTAPLAVGLQLMYLHRLTGALFGLDQIVTYTAMYLMIAPCGSCFSIDARLRRRFADRRDQSRWFRWLFPDASASVAANIATRLLQLHLCVIYLFGGLAKARGQSWWDGTALWFSVGNYEYQSINMTWLAHYPKFTSLLTHLTVGWEIFYCALVWPRLTRPAVLAMAVMVHGGIAMFLGMITFGVMMIVANMIFVRPEWVLHWFGQAESETASSDSADGDMPNEESKGARPKKKKLSGAGAVTKDSPSDQTIEDREERLRKASRRLRVKRKQLKEREQKYRGRVKKLKEREAKIKRLIERRRSSKKNSKDEPQGQPDSES